jgi:uncharacterized protein YbjT (DUF2867 family)
MKRRVFITGGTGYMGRSLIEALLARGYEIIALARPGSEGKLPSGCGIVLGDALNSGSYAAQVRAGDTFVQLVGVAHPGPGKAQQFESIDRKSAMEAIRAAKASSVGHFIYVSVAHPAPAMHAYIAARSACEAELVSTGLNATILRPWYVLGPGHRWPYALIPFYWIAERIPSTREGARRLGLVTRRQMIDALLRAVEHPARGIRILEVPEIRAGSSKQAAARA